MNSTQHPVLIVEPEPLTRFGISAVVHTHPLLRVCGEAGDARVARRLCSELKPDLIVLELVMPNGDGIELLREFSHIHPPARSIVVTNVTDPLSVQRSFRAGARGFVGKQEEPAELLAALEQVLSGETFVSARIAHLLVAPSGAGKLDQIKNLSDREFHILRRLGKKQGPTQIATELSLSVKTVETYQRRIIEKLNLTDGQQLHRIAEQWVQGSTERHGETNTSAKTRRSVALR